MEIEGKKVKVLKIFGQIGCGLVDGGDFVNVYPRNVEREKLFEALKEAEKEGLEVIQDCYGKQFGVQF